MTLADCINGPDWIIWLLVGVLVLLSIILISGHGSIQIAGYNTASKEDKLTYDEKKLCRTVGIGTAILAGLLLIIGLFKNSLPVYFGYIFAGIVLVDVVVIIILENTICRTCQSTFRKNLNIE